MLSICIGIGIIILSTSTRNRLDYTLISYKLQKLSILFYRYLFYMWKFANSDHNNISIRIFTINFPSSLQSAKVIDYLSILKHQLQFSSNRLISIYTLITLYFS